MSHIFIYWGHYRYILFQVSAILHYKLTVKGSSNIENFDSDFLPFGTFWCKSSFEWIELSQFLCYTNRIYIKMKLWKELTTLHVCFFHFGLSFHVIRAISEKKRLFCPISQFHFLQKWTNFINMSISVKIFENVYFWWLHSI